MDEEDDDWWVAAEMTASQTEQSLLQPPKLKTKSEVRIQEAYMRSQRKKKKNPK